jgi:hypothetical protein
MARIVDAIVFFSGLGFDITALFYLICLLIYLSRAATNFCVTLAFEIVVDTSYLLFIELYKH